MSCVVPPSTPPTSVQCAIDEAKRDDLALVKDRHVKTMWLRWLPMMYASLVSRMSPGIDVVVAVELDLRFDRVGQVRE